MPKTLTTAQLETAKAMIGSGTPTELSNFYDYMYQQGYGYAALANGVVNCQWATGTTAQNYMINSAGAQGVILDAAAIQKIEAGMANGYINTLLGYANSTGSTSQDISAEDALSIHSDPETVYFNRRKR
ncbi:hypothetical protein POF45_04060 [Pseudomonas sp. 681]|jgi:hypothetical protein|uniref:Uncharacterized protein n=1 Tax=Pseudomonas fungipugnans TaxID=3024217 RepID=A0ABT6QIF2_9PSED|nr:hypothetical protein [Pseudomonas sp. 681]MDI2590608.1 hypothetical protein [Pseudomonas sp. 681]